MIQRKQTIFYLVAVLILIIPLFGMDVVSFSNEYATHHVTFMGSYSEVKEMVVENEDLKLQPPVWPIYFANLVLVVLLLITIVLYKSLRLQLRVGRFVLGLYFLTLIGFAFMIYYLKMYMTVAKVELQMGSAVYLIAAGIVFVWLGNRGVLKDKKLIESVDRIR